VVAYLLLYSDTSDRVTAPGLIEQPDALWSRLPLKRGATQLPGVMAHAATDAIRFAFSRPVGRPDGD
jgi:hypothetical protein